MTDATGMKTPPYTKEQLKKINASLEATAIGQMKLKAEVILSCHLLTLKFLRAFPDLNDRRLKELDEIVRDYLEEA